MDDAVIRVDDTSAFQAFVYLFNKIHTENKKTLETAALKEEEAHNFIRFGYILIAVIFLVSSAVLILIRRLEVKSIEAIVASEAKSQFLSTMSHEIRTPLNGVLGLVQLLNMKKFSSEEQYHLNLIQSSGELLLDILNDVLDISKIEARELVLEDIPVDLDHLLATTTDFFKNVASEQGLIVSYSRRLDKVGYVNTDPTKLRQIISNILSNAVKFTPKGEITVTAEAHETEEAGQTYQNISIYITDTGIGMDRFTQSQIFDKFTQADAATSRKFGGIGLGLAISSELAALMGGSLEVQSELGKGSRFTLRLKLKQTSKEELATQSINEADYQTILSGLNVLIAEDNVVNSVVAKGFLENMGMSVKLAHTGTEAVQAFRKQTPDLILMDINMPDMDGIEACRAIRAIENGPRTPILALTADAFQETHENCLKAGMDGVITKPFSFEEIRNHLYDHLK